MRKRGLCCRPVSVCLSVTVLYCIQIQTANDIVKLRFRPGSAIVLVSYAHPVLPNFSRNLRSGGGWRKWDFRPKSPIILETVRDRPMVAMEC